MVETVCSLIQRKVGGGLINEYMSSNGHYGLVRDMGEIVNSCKKRCVELRIVRSLLSTHVEGRAMRRLLYDRITVDEGSRKANLDGRNDLIKKKREETKKKRALN